MGRISREDMLMGVASIQAYRGTCSRLQVGAVFSRDGRIISTGYNGAPVGIEHCDHSCDCTVKVCLPSCKSSEPCLVAEHAERNAIAFAARHGLALEGSALHVTHAPCLSCARSIINSGAVSVTFLEPYRIADGVELLRKSGIRVIDYRGLPEVVLKHGR